MSILKVKLTKEDMQFCEDWLHNYNHIVACITNRTFTIEILQKFAVYEATTRKRKALINRIVARYSKLRKREDLEFLYTLSDAMEDADGQEGE